MSEIKSAVNITWRYFYVLFYNVNYTHTQDYKFEAVMFIFENVCFYK